MKTTAISVPELMLIVGTRVALGVGIGLLIADKIDRDARRGAGCALLAVGVLSTIPLAIGMLSRFKPGEDPEFI